MSRIQNNIMALNTHRMYNKNNNSIQKSSEKLSSGYRINRAGDDAAGLAISEKMRAQIRGLNMASKNSNDAISLVQTAEGALQEVHTMLQRMNELAVQSASDTNVTIDRNALQLEFENLQEEIDQIAQTTKFNDTMLLDGSMGMGTTGVTLTGTGGAAGTNQAFTIDFAGPEGKMATLAFASGAAATSVTAAFDIDGNLTLTIAGKEDETVTQEMIDKALASAANAPANYKDYKATLKGGSVTVTGASTAQDAGTATEMKKAVQASNTNSNDVTFKMNKAGATPAGQTITISTAAANAHGATTTAAGATTLNLDATRKYTANEINAMLNDSGAFMSAEFSGEKTGAEIAADFTGAARSLGTTLAGTTATAGSGIASGGGIVIQVGAEEGHTLDLGIDAMNTQGLGITKAQANIATREAAQKAITVSRNAINTVSTQRAKLGAMQNRLEYKISNLDITAENLQAAESRIRDVDMAKEMTNFTKNNILTQAATAMLAQANAAPQNVLQLLG